MATIKDKTTGVSLKNDRNGPMSCCIWPCVDGGPANVPSLNAKKRLQISQIAKLQYTTIYTCVL